MVRKSFYIYHITDKTYYAGLKGNKVVFKSDLDDAKAFEESYEAEDEIPLLEELNPDLVANLITL